MVKSLRILFWITLMIPRAGAMSEQSEYRVAVPADNFYPHYYSEKGKIKGVVPDILRKFFSDLGKKVSFEAYPIKRYQIMLRKGAVDFICPSNPDWGDNAITNIKFSNPMLSSRSAYIRRLDQAREKIDSIATVSGYTYPEIPSEYKNGKVEVFLTQNSEAALRMLSLGRVSAVYLHLDFARFWLRNHNMEGKFYFESKLSYKDYSYHLATTKHYEILTSFDQWLQKNSGILDNLKNRHKMSAERL